MKQKLGSLLIFLSILSANLHAEADLQSGPMVGYSTMKEVLIWVQTDAAAEVAVEYWEPSHPEKVYCTLPVTTRRDEAFVAKCLADEVLWGREYQYRVQIDGEVVEPRFRDGYQNGARIPLAFHTPPNWRFQEEGHRVFDFRVAAGSCAYINERPYDRLSSSPYGDGYQIFESIYEKDPALMIWLGDDVYLREPDWTSRTGIFHRWTHTRSLPEMRPLLATVPQYAIWDDHDYGPNDAGWDFWNKAETTRAFQLFWGNPSAGLPELPGIFTFFNWGDVNFFLTDNRTYRTPASADPSGVGGAKQFLGKEQVDWLVDSLSWAHDQGGLRRSYPISFNVICIGNPALTDADYKDAYTAYPEEWEYLMKRLIDEGIEGVVFLTGDIHMSELSKLTIPVASSSEPGSTATFYDVTSSPLTAGPHRRPSTNTRRVDIFPGEADSVRERNFVTLDFEGPLGDRRMVIRYYDTNGKLLNQKPDAPAGEVTEGSVIYARDLKRAQQ